MIRVNNAEETARKDAYLKFCRNTELLNEYIRRAKRITFFCGESLSDGMGSPKLFDMGTDGERAKRLERLLSIDYLRCNIEGFLKRYNAILPEYLNCSPGVVHNVVFALKDSGKDVSVVTESVDGLFVRGKTKARFNAERQQVYEIYGSIHNYPCTRCGQDHNLDYFMNAAGNGTASMCMACDNSGDPPPYLRPGIALYGERLSEKTLAKAIGAVKKSDLLIVLGTDPSAYPARNILRHFKGEFSAVIDPKRKMGPSHFDIVMKNEPVEIFSLLDLDYCTMKSSLYKTKIPPFEFKYLKV